MLARDEARFCEDCLVSELPEAVRRAPLVIAHRGASASVPEHTLGAYVQALADGADGVECDVRLTADAHLVCVHDRRVERTSNGRGTVSTLELAQLEQLDWASWKRAAHADDTEGADSDPQRGRILTLRKLLDALMAEERELVTLIETKHPTRYGGLVERRLVTVLRDYGLTVGDLPRMPHVRVMSFSAVALQRMRLMAPHVPLVYLIEVGAPALTWDGSLPRGVHAVGLDVKFLRRHPKVVRHHQRRGHTVYVWTADRPEDVERCLDLGVDVIITNRPAEVLDRVSALR
jgi:glycerophosphoryl diester phosphodiesterase